jgi:hypothetical protein
VEVLAEVHGRWLTGEGGPGCSYRRWSTLEVLAGVDRIRSSVEILAGVDKSWSLVEVLAGADRR